MTKTNEIKKERKRKKNSNLEEKKGRK